MEEMHKIIAKHFGLAEVKNTDRLTVELGGDALDVIDLVMKMEDHFHIDIYDAEIESIDTVQDLCDCVTAKILKDRS